MTTKGPCVNDGCEAPAWARGMCRPCYGRWWWAQPAQRTKNSYSVPTHCTRGHSFAEFGFERADGRGRHCRLCNAERRRAWKARQQEGQVSA